MRLEVRSVNGDKICDFIANPGDTFSRALWLTGHLPPRPLCGGLGHCHLCKIRFAQDTPDAVPDEIKFFTKDELNAGWRLACKHTIGRDDKNDQIRIIEIPDLPTMQKDIFPAAKIHAAAHAVMGVDLGTTSIEWRALGLDHEILAQGKFANPQNVAGPDVISRLQQARSRDGLRYLAGLALDKLFSTVAALKKSYIFIDRCCIAGNSAMTAILLEKNIDGLCAAPWHLDWQGGKTVQLSWDGESLATIIPPLPGPFVGGDISAALLSQIDQKLSRPLLLADLGTNAELALLLPDDTLYMASVPLGPAMEGIGPQCGQPAGPGVTVAYTLGPHGLAPTYFDASGASSTSGISATGYLSILAILLQTGLMDSHGHFSQPSMPIAKRIAKNFNQKNQETILNLNEDLYLAASDVELLLKVKAAFSVGIFHLLAAAHMNFADVATFSIAGAIGEYANLSDLENLGFIPAGSGGKIKLCGNASLAGACLLAMQPQQLTRIQQLCAKAIILQLPENPDFFNDYIKAMQWS